MLAPSLRRFPVGVTPWIGIDAKVALPEVWYAAIVGKHEARAGAMLISARRAAVLRAPPTAKIVPRSLTTLPNFGGLSRSGDHLPVICHVSFGGDTGSHPAPLRFVCPFDRTGWRDTSNARHFCQLLPRVPVPSYAGSPTKHVANVEDAIKEAAVVAFPKSKRAKVQGNARTWQTVELVLHQVMS